MAYSYFAFLDVMGYRYYLKKDKKDGTEIFKEKLITSYRVFEQVELGTLHHKSISDSIFMSSPNNVVDFLKVVKEALIYSIFRPCNALEALIYQGATAGF